MVWQNSDSLTDFESFASVRYPDEGMLLVEPFDDCIRILTDRAEAWPLLLWNPIAGQALRSRIQDRSIRCRAAYYRGPDVQGALWQGRGPNRNRRAVMEYVCPVSDLG